MALPACLRGMCARPRTTARKPTSSGRQGPQRPHPGRLLNSSDSGPSHVTPPRLPHGSGPRAPGGTPGGQSVGTGLAKLICHGARRCLRRMDPLGFHIHRYRWTVTVHRLHRHGEAAAPPMILQRTGGLVVDRLLEAGYPVVCLCTPTSFHAGHLRWGARVRSLTRDRYKLANYPCTDGRRLRRLGRIEPGCASGEQ